MHGGDGAPVCVCVVGGGGDPNVRGELATMQ